MLLYTPNFDTVILSVTGVEIICRIDLSGMIDILKVFLEVL